MRSAVRRRRHRVSARWGPICAYTAYCGAGPWLVFGEGALGFFALSYTIMMYPVMFLVMPKLRMNANRNGYVTAADFVRQRFDCRLLGVLRVTTGILATVPYCPAVGQHAGLMAGLGIGRHGRRADIPLVVAFATLAASTYTGGLRAPAVIAIV